MTTSTNNLNDGPIFGSGGGAFADGLTLARLSVTPVIMALIVWKWPDPQVAILATFLFIIAALTDIFDDWFGGSSRSALRRFGWLDDIADTLLIAGVLSALSFVLYRNGYLHWGFAVPVGIIVFREILVGLAKGYELSRYGWPDNALSNAKGGFAMLGAALLVASPWLTQWSDRLRAGTDRVMDVYNAASPMVWIVGELSLWVAAIFSIVSGYKILTHKRSKEAGA